MAVVLGAGAVLSDVSRTANLPASSLAFATSCWAKWTVDTGLTDRIMSSRDVGSRNEMLIDTGSTNTRARVSNGTTTSTIGSATAITIDTWFYWALTTNGTNIVGYVWDEAGTLIGSLSSLAAVSYTPATVAWGRQVGAAGGFLQGKICYMRCWNANLSQAEFEAERTSATAVRTSNLLWNWKELTDDSGNGYDPTTTNVSTDSDYPTSVIVSSAAPALYTVRSAIRLGS